MVGDLVPVESESEVKVLIPEVLQNASVQAFWLEWSSVQYIDLFDKNHSGT